MTRTRELTEVLAWSLAAFLLATYSEALIIFSLGAIYGDVSKAPPEVLQNLVYVSPVFPLILGLAAVVRLKLGGTDVLASTGLFAKTIGGDALLGVFAGLACIGVAVTSLQTAARYMEVPAMHMMPAQVHLYFMTIGAVVPGLCEELFFRGMLMRVGSKIPAAAMILISAAAFSLWHVGTPAYLPHTFLMGLILGVLVIGSGRLAPAIIAHTVANAGMGLLFLQGFRIVGT
jgi:membrane protease YdiL (CAAX protease family)